MSVSSDIHQTSGNRTFPGLFTTKLAKIGILAIAIRKIALRLLMKVKVYYRADKTSNIQKLKNNGSKCDKIQIFFVSLPTK